MDKHMSTEFAGLTAVVTGAGSGIGLATATILKERGATVYGLDLAEGGMSGIATWVQCDLSDDASVAKAFEGITKLDILINNAAISAIGTVDSNSSEEWLKVLNVNVL
jgi:NAD(P)-dependent dehydrogenase (short-subunit alcohol dehydrogenase family)